MATEDKSLRILVALQRKWYKHAGPGRSWKTCKKEGKEVGAKESEGASNQGDLRRKKAGRESPAYYAGDEKASYIKEN